MMKSLEFSIIIIIKGETHLASEYKDELKFIHRETNRMLSYLEMKTIMRTAMEN